MKRFFRFVFLVAVALSVACAEDTTTDEIFADNGVVEDEYLGETVRLDINMTRASLDGLDMHFEAGDVVQVNGKNIPVQVDGKSAYLRVPIAEDNIYRAVFPAEAAAAFNDSGNCSYVHSNMQVYSPDSFGREAMCLVSYRDLNEAPENSTISFNALLGVLRLTVKGDAEIRSIRLQNNAFDQATSSTAMSGRTRFVNAEGVMLGHNNTEDAHHAAPAGASGMTEDIVLICNNTNGKGVKLSPEGTDFYFTVFPREYAKGFTVTISDNEGKSQKFSTEGSTTVAVNTLVAMQPMTYAPDSDLIFSETFDTCVYGGDIVAYRNGGSVWRSRTPIHRDGTVVEGLPIMSSHTDQDGLQPGYYYSNYATAVSGDGVTTHKVVTPGLVFADWSEENLGEESYATTMAEVIAAGKLRVTPELLNVRGLNDWYMSRCVEFHGYLSVGNEKALNASSSFKFNMNPLGILTTPRMTAIQGSENVDVYFDIAAGDGVTGYCKKDTPNSSSSFYTFQPNATEEDSANNISWREDMFRFFAVGDETATILKLEFLDENGKLMTRADGTPMQYAPSDNHVEVPESDLPANWCRVKVLVANATAKTRFRFYNNQATRYMTYHIDNIEVRKSEFEVPENANVTGTVTCSGEPMQGVVVSDGVSVTKTDAKGQYYLQTDTSTADHIRITIPSGYEMTSKRNISPAFFSPVKNTTSVQVHDFQLKKVDQSNYTILTMADSHVLNGQANFGSTEDRDLYRNSFMPKWNEYATSCKSRGPVYGIHLGDMTQRGYWKAGTLGLSGYPLTRYRSDTSNSTVSIFNVVGNHDHDIPASGSVFGEDEQHLARKSFTSALGPAYYSFEIGTEHYIVLDNVVMLTSDSVPAGQDAYKDSSTAGYKVKLDPIQMQWLQYDVANIDKTKIKGVVICAHCQFYFANLGYAMINGSEIMQLVKAFPVTFLIGHSHVERYQETMTPTYSKTVREYLIAALMGTAWHDSMTCTDGTPASFAAFTFANGVTSSREIIPFDKNAGMTERLYGKDSGYTITEGSFTARKPEDDGTSTTPAVMVNAWGAKTVTFKESTGGTGKTVRGAIDPYYRTWYYQSLESSDRNSILCNSTYPDGPSWQYPYNNKHIWKYIPANASATITATITDEFGNSRTVTLQAK